MTPIDAARREIMAELDALERRIGSGAPPVAIEIRVEFDRESQMPRSVECHEDRARRILGGSVPTRAERGGHGVAPPRLTVRA